MSSFQLKVIAVITMLIDHVGSVFFPQYRVLRMIGRWSFPIYAFLLVEGFYYTRNMKKYLLRLLGFAVVSEVPFDLALYGELFYTQRQNVYWTLFLGLLMLVLLERLKQPVIQGVIIAGAALTAQYFSLNYRYVGIIMIFLFYVFRVYPNSSDRQMDTRFAQIISVFTLNIVSLSSIQWVGGLSLLPIQFYNGKRGRFHWKYFFYAFYPVHLFVLYLIKQNLV